MAVNRQKQHSDKEVAKLAGEIVSKWRDDVNKTKSTSKKTAASPPKTANGDGSVDKSTTLAKVTVPPAQRDWTKDKVDINRTGNKTRDNCLGLLYNGLAFMSEEGTFSPQLPENKRSLI